MTMNILYFGTVCEPEHYSRLLEGCRSKPSVSTLVFENALLSGFAAHGTQMEICSYPMIPPFPRSPLLHFGGNSQMLPSGYRCRWLNTVNIPVLKQYSRSRDARKILRRWGEENRGNGLILTYSIPPFLIKDILRCAETYDLKTAAIVPDLLRDMYMNENPRSPVTMLKNVYLRPALRLQDRYDGYIYLTDAMHAVVAPDKPYTVMEGIADASAAAPPCTREKADPPAVMYAGMLHEKYGILSLLDAFEALDAESAELWLFGDGTAAEQVKARAAGNPRIRYFGVVPHSQILAYERRASLLVNLRPTQETYTEYSFPSKTIEYMLSGTPLLTTRLKGIPDAYFDYVFTADSGRPEDLARAMRYALTRPQADRMRLGERAQRFIRREKNAAAQTAGLLAFLEESVMQ